MPHKHHHRKQKIKGLRKKKKFYHFKAFWIALLLLVIGGGLAYFLFLSPVFLVEANAQYLIPGRSIFLINSRATEQAILKAYPDIETATVEKHYPATVTVTIKKRQPFSIFCNGENACFSLDKNGVIFEAQANAGNTGLVVTSDGNQGISEGQQVITKEMAQALIKIRDNLKNNFNIDTREAFVSNPLVLKTSEQWKVYFDPTEDIDLQITKMDLLLKDQIPAKDRLKMQYIYLQYKDRAYYK